MEHRGQRIWNWISNNLVLPFIPMLVRILVHIFANVEIPMWDTDDLLYYNFFICLLLLFELKNREDLLTRIFRVVLYIVCGIDNIFVALVLTGNANNMVLSYSLIAAAICVCIGIIYAIVGTFIPQEG